MDGHIIQAIHPITDGVTTHFTVHGVLDTAGIIHLDITAAIIMVIITASGMDITMAEAIGTIQATLVQELYMDTGEIVVEEQLFQEGQAIGWQERTRNLLIAVRVATEA